MSRFTKHLYRKARARSIAAAVEARYLHEQAEPFFKEEAWAWYMKNITTAVRIVRRGQREKGMWL